MKWTGDEAKLGGANPRSVFLTFLTFLILSLSLSLHTHTNTSSSSSSSSSSGTTRLQIEDLPNVIPILQLQQSNLKYVCKNTDIPRSSRFYMPMVQMTEATQYLGDRMVEVTPKLSKLIERDPEQYGWIEEAVDTAYFQLRMFLSLFPSSLLPFLSSYMFLSFPNSFPNKTGTDNRHHSEDVEYLSSKTVVRGVQLVIVYFGGSYYVQVSDAEGSHSLLNTRFPDVSWQARGYRFNNLSEYRSTKSVDTSHFRDLALWEGKEPEDELPDLIMDDEDDDEMLIRKDEDDVSSKVVEKDMELKEMKLLLKDDDVEEENKKKRKQKKKKKKKRSRKKSTEDEDDVLEDESSPVIRPEFRARAPVRLGALKGSGGSGRSGIGRMKLGKLKGFSSGPAPWEKGGRPLLLSKKK